MKAYVITKGEYSDYHICAVTLDETEAKKAAAKYSERFEKAKIEIYDLGFLSKIFNSHPLYKIIFNNCGDVIETTICENDELRIDSPIDIWSYVYVHAKDEQSAIKRAAEIRAEYLASEAGIT